MKDLKSLIQALSNSGAIYHPRHYLRGRIAVPPWLEHKMPARTFWYGGSKDIADTVADDQASAADGVNLVNHPNNGLPTPLAARQLIVPLPLPAQTKIEVNVVFPSLITVGTAGRIGVWLDGVMIRKCQ